MSGGDCFRLLIVARDSEEGMRAFEEIAADALAFSREDRIRIIGYILDSLGVHVTPEELDAGRQAWPEDARRRWDEILAARQIEGAPMFDRLRDGFGQGPSPA